MRQILLDNAFEAWAAAIRFCKDIKDGKCTLQYQKSFISSLHNAVELFMKQMMLNDGNHDVAYIRGKAKNGNKQLSQDYTRASDLNGFFASLLHAETAKFASITFEMLKKQHRKIFKDSLAPDESLEYELTLLQQLRNDETHFAIHQGSFLSEEDFCVLHNFMVRFYKVLEDWRPQNENDDELWLLPHWGDSIGADSVYGFAYDPLQSFSYEEAVRGSKLSHKIVTLLSDGSLYGAPDFSPYTIAKDLLREHEEYEYRFDEIWALVHMMQLYKIRFNEKTCVIPLPV